MKTSPFLLLITLCISLFFLKSCGYPTENNCYSDHELNQDILSISHAFDSIPFHQIDEQKLTAYIENESPKNKGGAYLKLRKQLLLRKYYLDNRNLEKTAEIGLNIITNYAHCLESKKLKELHQGIGNHYMTENNYFLSSYFYKKSLEFATDDFCTTNEIIGECYFQLEMFDSAIVFYRRSYECTETLTPQIRTLNSLGYAHFKNNETEKSEARFAEAINLYKANKTETDEFQLLNLWSNIASCNIISQKYDLALANLDSIRDSEYYQNNTSEAFKFEVRCKLAEVYFYKEERQLFKNQFSLINNYPTKTYSGDHIKLLNTRIQDAILFSDEFAIDEALKALQIAQRNVRSFRSNNIITTLKWNQEINQDNFKNLSNNIELKDKQKKLVLEVNNLYRVSIISGFIILLFLGMILYYRSRRRKINHEMEQVQVKNMKLEVKEQMRLIGSNVKLYEEIINKLETTSKSGELTELNNLILFLKTQKQKENKKEVLLNYADSSNLFDFKERAKSLHHNLTSSELEVMVLIHLGMSNKDMAIFRNVEPHSIRVFKNRLKKKLGLSGDQDLTNYVKNI